MSRVNFRIEDGDVLMFRDGARAMGTIGTLKPNDEQVARILCRVFEEGRKDKAREIRAVLGCAV